ncbi:hypothetical protein Ruko_09450 [Ruthenibacterium sp. TH_2024_36131]|uniref:hypothetical protein n=1 Tax=Owariibacterium komagatae TaxID=3136601 RepID=UPI0038B3094A
MINSILSFINNNGVLFGFLGILVTAASSLLINKRKENRENIKDLKAQCENLKQELQECKAKLEDYQSIEKAETRMDKSLGSIYQEHMPDGSTRNICGYCWEKEHIKIPLVPRNYASVLEGGTYKWYECRNCKAKHYTN